MNKLPKLKGLASNVYLWAKGRDVFRNFGIEYVARCEHFLGAFFVIVAGAGLYQTIRIFVGLSEEATVQTLKVTTGNVLLAFWLTSFLGAFVAIVLSGIRANRQLLLQRNAILRHIRRHKAELEFHRHDIMTNQQGGQKAIEEAERVQAAFVSIEREFENESEVDMLRILTMPVDKKMLGAIFTLLGTVSATIGQVMLLATGRES